MPKKLDVVIPPTDKTAEEVAKALFRLSPSATKSDKARKSSLDGGKPMAASVSPDPTLAGDDRRER